MKGTMLGLGDFANMADERRKNKFDVNVAVSGERGNGKSTFLFKFFLKFDEFKPWDHIVYSRKDSVRLLEAQKFGFIFDDEAITSAYKRNFFESEQKSLIQMLNMYRDQFNIYAMAIPNFYSLDRDMRDLVKFHLHIISRGVAVLHCPKTGTLYSEDKWDVKYNKKIEDSWAKIKKKDPGFKPPYHKLSTFVAYIKFGDLGARQRRLYEKIKQKKRKELYDEEIAVGEGKTFTKKAYDVLMEGNLSKSALVASCRINGQKYSSVQTKLNQMLTDNQVGKTLTELLQPDSGPLHNSSSVKGNELIPAPATNTSNRY